MEGPGFLRVGVEEIRRRAEVALGLLGPGRCLVCPRGCRVDRLGDVTGLCGVGRFAIVAAHAPHFGEEDCLRGRKGSGTIFFSGCGLRCVFCQNHDISWVVQGERTRPERLAGMMLELQDRGCHNINLLTPEHVVPQILEALPYAIDGGLRVPLVYNTSSYDSLDSLRLLDGIVDVYVPDLKVWSGERARRLLRMPGYPEASRAAVREMHRQVGTLVLDEAGMARRGVLLRHLLMPGLLDETETVLRWVRRELGAGTYVHLMTQYFPAGLVGRDDVRDGYAEIDRRPGRDEMARAAALAHELGLRVDPRGAARFV